MKRSFIASVAVLIAGVMIPSVGIAAKETAGSRGKQEYVVLYRMHISKASARAAIAASGGTIVRENSKLGVATIESYNPNFLAEVRRHGVLKGAAHNRSIGSARPDLRLKPTGVEALGAGLGADGAAAVTGDKAGGEPLGVLQWNMLMINATPIGSYAAQSGSRKVVVGILDSGIDASHPDIEPNFDPRLSRNFTRDIPLIDGPCDKDPDGSCTDPANVDENGHGTHVAGIVAAARNGLGVAGVAPKITLSNLRVGQDSGYVFLQPTVDALTYAGDHGVDVANMSFFIDPWLFNCRDHPADTPEEQLEQRTIIAATQRALNYAHRRGVTLVAALGNSATDLGHPEIDPISPDFPPGNEKTRRIDNSCLTMPTEGRHVIGVSALGPSARKAYYSNYGVEQTDVSAPGGDDVDDALPYPQNMILSTFPRSVLEELELIDDNGDPLIPEVVRDCKGGECAYYVYLEGTSMASPHAAGVASLIVSEFGHRDQDQSSGLTADPDKVATRLKATARDHACPPGGVQKYPELEEFIGEAWVDFTAVCKGNKEFNGFYGHGIVDALSAVGR